MGRICWNRITSFNANIILNFCFILFSQQKLESIIEVVARGDNDVKGIRRMLKYI